MTEPDQKLLIIQLKADSYKAFNILYDLYFDKLYGFIFNLTYSHDKTAELVQETFIKVWINRNQIDPEQSFKAWLYKIARNHLLDTLKKQWNNPVFEDYLTHVSNEKLTENTSKESLDFDMFRKLLEKAKKKLSPRQREIFELSKEQDYTAQEIALKLDISEQAVYNYLSQAKNILRKEMKPFQSLLILFF